jgi:hypothetical protein
MNGTYQWQALTGFECCRFNPRRKLELAKPEEWRRFLHHVTVEVLALAQAGRDVGAVYTERAVKEEDWMRTAHVQVKVTNGAVELQLPSDDTLELILKAVPESLAEEIIMAAENAEVAPEPVSEESAQGLAQESAQEDIETATELLADEIAQEPTKQYVDPKDIDVAEKSTMRAIRDAVRTSAGTAQIIGQKGGQQRAVILRNLENTGFLRTPLTDPTIKLAVSFLVRTRNTEMGTNASTDSQACAAIKRQART